MQTVEAADYHDIATPSDPRVAPGGERVAFVRREPRDDEETEATVYVAPTGGGQPRRFTVAEGADSEPRWSPSGDRLAVVSTRGADDDRPQLWVLPTDGGEARQVTNVAGGVSQITWSPDGTRIAFCQQASAEDRERDRDREVPADYEPDEPDPRVIDRTVYRSTERYFDGRRSHVYVATLGDDTAGSDDEVRRLTGGDADFESPTWGDADTLYYAERVGDDPDDAIAYEILAHDLGDDDSGPDSTDPGAVESLHRTTGWTSGLAATTDGRVAFCYQDDDRATLRPTELKVFDRTADADSDAQVSHPTAGFDRTLGLDAMPQWGPDDEFLYFVAPDRGRVPVWRVAWDGDGDGDSGGDGDGDGDSGGDGDGDGDGPGPEPVVVDGHVDGMHVGADLLAYTQSEWDHPGDVFVATKGGGERRRLTRLNSDYLDERAVAQPEPVFFDSDNETAPTTPDGEPATAAESGDGAAGDVQGWVLTPPEFGGPDQEGDGEQFPLVVEIHGGPHAMWSTAGTMWHEFQTLAARGYVVFWCNPRGSTGSGEDYAAAIERDWGAVTAADVLAGADTVADRDYVDADQQFVTGGSFGGFQTAWLVGHTDRFAAAVAQRGVYDLTGFYGSTDAAYKLVEGDFDATPWDDPDFLWDRSPASAATDVTTPTLVIHSDDDYRTPANTAELFHRGLRKAGVDTRMVRYPREGHELSRSGEPGHVVDRIERIARWFDGYSESHDAPRALDRPDDPGLSAGADGEDDEMKDGDKTEDGDE